MFRFYQPGNSVHEHPGFTAACSRNDQHVARWSGHSLALRVIEIVEYVCDVH